MLHDIYDTFWCLYRLAKVISSVGLPFFVTAYRWCFNCVFVLWTIVSWSSSFLCWWCYLTVQASPICKCHIYPKQF